MSNDFHFHLAVGVAMAIALSIPSSGQSTQPTEAKMANIMGTVTDVNGAIVPNATVSLDGPDMNDDRTVVTNENGFFEFRDVKSGIRYHITVGAMDLAEWTSPVIILDPGQFKILASIQLRIVTERTAVQVTYDTAEVASEQFEAEEKQRVLGFIPNFYVSYDPNGEPLTTKRKFQLALKVATDPFTSAGIFFVSSVKQAGNTPRYGQGWGALGERLGATAADGFSDIMIGGAILPSLLHQDPRYFYQGTGTTGSRIRHAVFSTFTTRADNGKWQPNYSSLGGDLAASGLARLYYPRSDRGAGLLFGNFAIGTAERIGANLAEEFIVCKFSRRSGHVN